MESAVETILCLSDIYRAFVATPGCLAGSYEMIMRLISP